MQTCKLPTWSKNSVATDETSLGVWLDSEVRRKVNSSKDARFNGLGIIEMDKLIFHTYAGEYFHDGVSSRTDTLIHTYPQKILRGAPKSLSVEIPELCSLYSTPLHTPPGFHGNDGKIFILARSDMGKRSMSTLGYESMQTLRKDEMKSYNWLGTGKSK